MLKITKFGGSSVADASQFRKVKNIIESDPSRRFVVVSACGKSESEPNKITDLLYLCQAHIEYHVDYHGIFNMIRDRYLRIKKELKLEVSIEEELASMEERLPKMSVDEIVSRGEYFTARLMADYLGFPFVDACEVIHFNYSGGIDYSKTQAKLEQILKQYDRFVMPGFYGKAPDGSVKVMTRGGSDITGSVLAKCLKADLYENWTDVSGILMADPRIVKNPREIEKITFAELRELSYMGAGVLHEEAVFPVREADIPINILNTNRPYDKGTIIKENFDTAPDDPLITGVTGRKGFSAIAIYKTNMSEEVGLLKKALSVFEKYSISVEHLPTGVDSISILVREKDIRSCRFDVLSELKEKTGADDVKYMDDIAMVACVGRNMSRRIGTSGRLFSALGKKDINVKLIIQSFDEINILVGVSSGDFETTIRTIYNEFISD